MLNPQPRIEREVRTLGWLLAHTSEDTALTAPPGIAEAFDPASAAGIMSSAWVEEFLHDPGMYPSWVGPLLIGHAARALPATGLCDAVLALRCVPVRLHRVLAALVRGREDVPAELLHRTFLHLEALLADLPEGIPPEVTRMLGLPRSIGLVLDGVVCTFESCDAPPPLDSASLPLLLTAERLGLRSVLDVEPLHPGVLGRERLPVSPVTFRGFAQSLHLLGSRAALLRSLVLLRLLEDAEETPVHDLRLLLGLLLLPGSAVPATHVIQVWKLSLL